MMLSRSPQRSGLGGFSLIELLVSMVIGLVVTLAITSVLIRTEGSKRSTTSVNDLNQTGAYVGYVLDRAIRNAGSGLSQRWSNVYGCQLDAKAGNAVGSASILSTLPATSAFKNMSALPVRLAPVVIAKGLANPASGGDVLIVMSGASGVSEIPQSASVISGSSSVQLKTTLGYQTNDLVLLVASDGTKCMVQQAGAVTTPTVLPLAGTYFASTGGRGLGLTDARFAAGAGAIAMQLGTDATNPPLFQMFAVDSNRTLSSLDLLQPGDNATPIADGIIEMRAVYGVDSSAPLDGVLDTWIDPVAGSGYEASVLLNGSATSQLSLRRIVAIRLGFILRTSLAEKAADYQLASGTTLTLFSDLAVPQTRSITGADDTRYRYRTVEVTIPLRNVLLAPTP